MVDVALSDLLDVMTRLTSAVENSSVLTHVTFLYIMFEGIDVQNGRSQLMEGYNKEQNIHR